MLYTYRNKETGAVVAVPSLCGGVWELVEDKPAEEPAKPEKKAPKKTTKKAKK